MAPRNKSLLTNNGIHVRQGDVSSRQPAWKTMILDSHSGGTFSAGKTGTPLH
jgi:hypothetical protein